MNETEPYLESRGLPTTIVEPVLEQAAPEYAAKKARAAKAEKARQSSATTCARFARESPPEQRRRRRCCVQTPTTQTDKVEK